jgi:hypothetical protein
VARLQRSCPRRRSDDGLAGRRGRLDGLTVTALTRPPPRRCHPRSRMSGHVPAGSQGEPQGQEKRLPPDRKPLGEVGGSHRHGRHDVAEGRNKRCGEQPVRGRGGRSPGGGRLTPASLDLPGPVVTKESTALTCTKGAYGTDRVVAYENGATTWFPAFAGTGSRDEAEPGHGYFR